MKLEFVPYPQPEEEGPPSDRPAAREAAPSGSGKRSDPRCRVEAKAFRVERKRIFKKPSEDAAWTNWELLD